MSGLLIARRASLRPSSSSDPNAYRDAVLADSPGVYLRLQDGSGTSAADSSGNSHTATFSSAPTWGGAGPITSDPSSKSIVMAGSSRLFIASASWMFNSSVRAGTAEGWFKLSSTGATYTIMERRAGPTSGSQEAFRFAVRGDSGNKLEGIVWNQLGSNVAVTSSGAVNDNAWHHGALTWATDFGANTTAVKLFLDGIQVASTTLSDKAVSDVAELTFGAENDSTRVFPGSLAELAYYPVSALSSTRVAAHYAAR